MNGHSFDQWIVQDTLKNSMKKQNEMISFNFMAVSVILQIAMAQDLVDRCICNFRSYLRN